MRIAVHTASNAVRQTLEAIVALAGHQVAKAGEDADATLRDLLHPSANPLPGGLVIALDRGETPLDCPMRPETLIQRLSMHEQTQAVMLGNGWALDLLARTLTHPLNGTTTLTEKECSLLRMLAAANPDAMTRDALLQQVWGIGGDVDTHTLETHIYRLRAKLGELKPSPGDIVTADSAYQWVHAA